MERALQEQLARVGQEDVLRLADDLLFGGVLLLEVDDQLGFDQDLVVERADVLIVLGVLHHVAHLHRRGFRHAAFAQDIAHHRNAVALNVVHHCRQL